MRDGCRRAPGRDGGLEDALFEFAKVDDGGRELVPEPVDVDEAGGSGLGLAIAAGLAASMGMELWASAGDGRFTVAVSR